MHGDEEATMATLSAHRALVDELIARHRGRIANTAGDSVLAEFALHIIKKKAGPFDPKKFDDRYDAALLELVKAKMGGRKIEAPEPARPTDLMEALRQSADVTGAPAAKPKRSARKTAATKTKTS